MHESRRSTLWRTRCFGTCTFPFAAQVCCSAMARSIERAADLLRHPLIHYDWMNGDPEAPTWRQWLAVARSIDPDFKPLEKAWDLSFREELHAIDAVVSGQGVAICSDVVVSNELRSGLLVKPHPLSLPGYGVYLVSMIPNP